MALEEPLHNAIKSFGSRTLDRFRLVSSISMNRLKGLTEQVLGFIEVNLNIPGYLSSSAT